MKQGHIKLSRKMFDGEDALWEDGTPYDSRSAWIWLIQHAAFKAYVYRGVDPLERGEFVASVRFLAERFGWSKSAVQRWIARAEKAGRIAGQRMGHLGKVYRIVKYDAYQTVERASGTPDGTAIGTEAGQKRDKQESSKAVKQTTLSAPSDAEADRPNLFRLAPFLESWREKFGGDPPAARFGKVFKRLVITKGYGEAEVLRRWLICLAVKGDFATPEELASKWDRYAVAAVPTAKPVSVADTLAVLSVEYELVARSDRDSYRARMERALADPRVTDRAQMEAAIRLAKPWELGATKREWLAKEMANRLAAGGFAA